MFGAIEIISPPQGEAPLEIRKTWIGLQIPCLYKYTKQSDEVTIFGAVTNKVTNFNPSYAVFQKVAIDLLGEKSAEAKKWWNDHGYPSDDVSLFYFNSECAKEIGHIPTREELKSIGNN